MPPYAYTAKSSPQQTLRGEIEAESTQDAVNKLTKMGYFPLEVRLQGLRDARVRFQRVGKKDITEFSSQLASLIESGVNILNGLNLVAAQTNNKYLKSVLTDACSKIKDGKPLSESLAAYPHVFSGLYTSMVRSGEIEGNIGGALRRLSNYLEKEEEFNNSLRAAMTYPAFVLGVSVLTIVVLLVFVIPRLVKMFEDLGQALPLPTQVLINVSGFMRNYWWLILAANFALFFLLQRIYQRPQMREHWDKFKFRLPAWGNIVLKTEVSRLMRTLSLLISSGMPISPALEVTASVAENTVLRKEVLGFKEQINNGASFSHALKNSQLIPEFASNIIVIGEETGTLAKALMRVAEDYESEVDRRLKAAIRLLEPMIILIMGLIVGFIVLSMLLPIFQINLIAR